MPEDFVYDPFGLEKRQGKVDEELKNKILHALKRAPQRFFDFGNIKREIGSTPEQESDVLCSLNRLIKLELVEKLHDRPFSTLDFYVYSGDQDE